MDNLSGKVALVTGAGGMRGVGRATALELAREGADIVISDVKRAAADLPPQELKAGWRSLESVQAEVQALGRRCHVVWCDLSAAAQVPQLIEQAISHFGAIDILVNNARAIIGRDKVPVTELDEAVWRRFLDINLTAVFLATKFAGRAMIRRGQGGAIVNIGSENSKRAYPCTAAYTASKFAMIGLTQAAALDLAPHQITVNAVCPGMLDTDRMSYWEQDQARQQGVTQEEFRARVVADAAKAIPLGRIGESEDVARAVAFLAGSKSGFITGQAINVNGGSLFH
jgi:NAD(P)-dependent dehydrogenase (short-subunit alcohol dehydrogenase family)